MLELGVISIGACTFLLHFASFYIQSIGKRMGVVQGHLALLRNYGFLHSEILLREIPTFPVDLLQFF